MRISDYMQRSELALNANVEIHAAVRENFTDVDGGHKCKLCGDIVKHPRAAAAHLAVHHRKNLEANNTGFDEIVGEGMKCRSCGKVMKAEEMEAHGKMCGK